GKTAAFGLPMIEYVDPQDDAVQGLVLTPTRELCIQVTQAIRAYAARKGVDVVAVFGGAPIRSQQAQLRGGGQIVVGTVGRVLDPERPAQAIVFVRTKIRCEQLYRTLRDKGWDVKALHGDMSQGARDGVMISFKEGRLPLLVATDVAARGLDISSVTHVINFDVPTSPDVYVHRIGRTGRVGRSGRAITFYEPRQEREVKAIERNANTEIAAWSEGAHTEPRPVQERPRRHSKPHLSRNGREP